MTMSWISSSGLFVDVGSDGATSVVNGYRRFPSEGRPPDITRTMRVWLLIGATVHRPLARRSCSVLRSVARASLCKCSCHRFLADGRFGFFVLTRMTGPLVRSIGVGGLAADYVRWLGDEPLATVLAG